MTTATVLVGDVLDRLRELPDASVQCVVTSPPYWGLRDYGTAKWEGGDAGCDHSVTSGGPSMLEGASQRGRSDVSAGDCRRCGARRIDAQIGLEPTPEAYVAKMVEVFREVRRVMRDDGTLWLNIGDSYAGSPIGTFNGGGFKDGSAMSGGRDLSGVETSGKIDKLKASGLKPKDLVGIPWRLAFALQADGWFLRSDIIWAKPNPMPESVTDRPTKSHEYVFLLTKRARYYFDADAVRESSIDAWKATDMLSKSFGKNDAMAASDPDMFRTRGRGTYHSDAERTGRNIRTVWTIATEAFPEAHFATYPRKLVEPCIKAGTSERGACPECGAGWVRQVEHTPATVFSPASGYGHGAGRHDGGRSQLVGAVNKTTGWRQGCSCCTPDPITPCLVLDPFAGSGTTGVVALSLGRSFVGIELNPEYAAMAERRLSDVSPLLATTTVEHPAERQDEMFTEARP